MAAEGHQEPVERAGDVARAVLAHHAGEVDREGRWPAEMSGRWS